MRVLMLGWEFPPYISGGLGTACYGLTKGLDRRGVEVIFVLPQPVTAETASHVKLLSPASFQKAMRGESPASVIEPRRRAPAGEFEHAEFVQLPISVGGAYSSSGQTRTQSQMTGKAGAPSESDMAALAEAFGETARAAFSGDVPQSTGYAGDLITQVRQYAFFCAAAARLESFDVIHAHDWLTYPAGLAIARLTGKPLVAHIHSTEFDRSGDHVNQTIYDIERRGMHGALRVIAVSRLTKGIVTRRYGVNPAKVEVVYNGVDIEPTQSDHIGIGKRDKIVLFFGRITMQKGPEYFVRAAKRVLEVLDDVKFVVAGSGDLATQMIEMAARFGIGHKMLFTGFLRGRDIDRVFALADVYVMPSVSEPFGIAPLEAMSRDVPVIISKSSGVSEVLNHALKVDFWDVDDMANKIVAVLRHPPLQRTLTEHGAFEVRRLTWDGAAERCEQIYRAAIAGIVAHA